MKARRALILLGVTTFIALTALIAVVLTQPFASQSVAPPPTVTAAPVTVQPFEDAREVSAQLTFGNAVTLRSPVNGTVTSLQCITGAAIVSGEAPLEVDGDPILALHGETPWWRDLSMGTQGQDVDALQAELTRLGYDTGTDAGRFGSATSSALQALLVEVGLPTDDPVMSGALRRTMWLPESSVRVGSCDAALGSPLAIGDAVLSTTPTITAARLSTMPSASTEWVFDIDDVAVRVLTDGTVAPEDLERLSSLPSVLTAASDSSPVNGTLHRADTVEAAAIPPGAIATDDGISGCVLGDGAPAVVTILGSQLGQTYVTFEEVIPTSVALIAPELSACG